MSVDKLQEFREAVAGLAESKSDFVFRNDDHEHAAIVISNMLKVANKSFVIYDDDLSGDIAEKSKDGELYDCLTDFVNRGGLLRIVVDEVSNTENNIYQHIANLKQQHSDNVFLSKSNDELRSKVNKFAADSRFTDTEINFASGDSCSFRLETVKNERKAICSFNKPDIASHLTSIFDSEFEHCAVLM